MSSGSSLRRYILTETWSNDEVSLAVICRKSVLGRENNPCKDSWGRNVTDLLKTARTSVRLKGSKQRVNKDGDCMRLYKLLVPELQVKNVSYWNQCKLNQHIHRETVHGLAYTASWSPLGYMDGVSFLRTTGIPRQLKKNDNAHSQSNHKCPRNGWEI